MKKLVIGNWKMHGSLAMADALVAATLTQAERCPATEVVLCPPAALLTSVQVGVSASNVLLGAQDCHFEAQGAHTGDVSADLLKEIGCSYVIVGHSERRAAYNETDDLVRQKAARAIMSDLIPIICIGETQADRDSGQAEMVISQQVQASIPDEAGVVEGDISNFVLAYEPVWAIGSGKTPTLDDIRTMHQMIVAVASKKVGMKPEQVRVLYGGSVKGDNAQSIMETDAVSGVLVGGASLKADQFAQIIAGSTSLMEHPAVAGS